ncbi:uncharacterized protein EI97DRAFT_267301 [Westerdykella ornata]|uniref:Uncharacterized protein n=1 Tax=Westerdykella ornata TaxID=318751 RepID=A0A6A6J5I9_WESOR|nr:uncharacterized protein EI97DRAFT_267301 [Westerdykella ornata]KAF2271484.1 hypothetical protein EI97DRAFT_267301 [Westerdykella ornata]
MLSTHIPSLLVVVLTTATTLTSASPILRIRDDVAPAAATSHNVYLLTCSPTSGRWGYSSRTVSAVGFFGTPIQNNKQIMDQVAILRSPAASWEGNRSTAVWNDLYFALDIARGADDLGAGELAGTATVGRENFACFRDGETTIVIAEGAGWPASGGPDDRASKKRQNGGDTAEALKVRCTADYWCGSVS